MKPGQLVRLKRPFLVDDTLTITLWPHRSLKFEIGDAFNIHMIYAGDIALVLHVAPSDESVYGFNDTYIMVGERFGWLHHAHCEAF